MARLTIIALLMVGIAPLMGLIGIYGAARTVLCQLDIAL